MPNKAKSKKGSTKRKASKASTQRMTKYTEKGEDITISCKDNAVRCIYKWLYKGVQQNLLRATQRITKKAWSKNGHGYEFENQSQILCEIKTARTQLDDLENLVKSGYSKDYGDKPISASQQADDDGTPEWERERKSVKISA